TRARCASGSKVITDPGELGRDLLEVSLDGGTFCHRLDGSVGAVGRITVIVSPGAKRTEIVGREGDAWRLRVAAARERGHANEAVCRLLANALSVDERDVAVVSGSGARVKIVEVGGVDLDAIDRTLARCSSS
ncbi:MAG: DUF167 domain-containing protein, partial [Actinomycetota bacterium]|nr:DUF167 domain-containing protein [Actinomycetota bacterium]